MKIVTGMHRSGTSFISNFLQALGLNFGPEELLLPSNKWNVKGYFENKEIINLNNKIVYGNHADVGYWIESYTGRTAFRRFLASLAWSFAKTGYLRFPDRKVLARRAAAKKETIAGLAVKYSDCVIKDVRFSLTYADWVQSAHLESILYCYRNPRAVALSLKKREHIPLWLGYRIWNYYVRMFFSQLDEVKITLVNYDNFFDSVKRIEEAGRLYSFAGKPFVEEEASRLLGAILKSDLRHYGLCGGKMPAEAINHYRMLNELHDVYCEPRPFDRRDAEKIAESS